MSVTASRESARSSGKPSSSRLDSGSPSRRGEDGLGSVAGTYLQLFGRPPLGDHPELDGYAAGRMLAEEYPERMMELMSGIRQGLKRGSKAADTAGGQNNG